MAELVTLARPYAAAVFALANEQHALQEWLMVLQTGVLVAEERRILARLENPALSQTEKLALLDSLGFDRFSASAKVFVRLLLKNNRFRLFPEILKLFQALKDAAESVLEARIVSAFPLEAEQLEGLTAGLEKRYGRKFRTVTVVDAGLLGGVRIEIGDQVIDGSIKGRLAMLANSLHS